MERHVKRTSSARELGVVYTPIGVAALLAHRMLDACADDKVRDVVGSREPVFVLDPACGDGVLLDAVRRAVASLRIARPSASPQARLHLCGVDIDRDAVAACERRLAVSVANDGPLAAADECAAYHIRLGNSLTGPAFTQTDASTCRGAHASIMLADHDESAIDWSRDFPEPAARGGFDFIVGNPPYRRERDAKELFDRLHRTPWGRLRQAPRADLWHHFLHRGLDLLRPGGRLAFLVTSYWLRSPGTRLLRERLRAESVVEEILDFGATRIFPGVSGRHMIVRLRKRADTASHRRLVADDAADSGMRAVDGPSREHSPAALPEDEPCHLIALRVAGAVRDADWLRIAARSPVRYVAQSELLGVSERGAPRRVTPEFAVSPVVSVARGVSPGRMRDSSAHTLAAHYLVRQGIAENPPAVARRHLDALAGKHTIGTGVFVLTETERERLGLSPAEEAWLRPYLDTRQIGRFELPRSSGLSLLYLDRRCRSLDELPAIASHLGAFRVILERRREARSGRMAWWQLHWPRDEAVFLAEKVLAVQMARRPSFAYAPQPAFVGFSVNVIVHRVAACMGEAPGAASTPGDGEAVSTGAAAVATWSLAALTGLLNSRWAATWFETHAKRRGVACEINGHLLREFPLPPFDAEADRRLHALVIARQSPPAPTLGVETMSDVESEIDAIVVRLYADRDSGFEST